MSERNSYRMDPSLRNVLARLATRDELTALSDKVDVRLGALEKQMGSFKETVDRIDSRTDRVEEAVLQLTRSVARLEEKVSQSAPRTWVLGGVISVLLAILGAGWLVAQPYVTTLMRLAAASGV